MLRSGSSFFNRKENFLGFRFFAFLSLLVLVGSFAMLLIDFTFPGRMDNGQRNLWFFLITLIVGKWCGYAAGKATRRSAPPAQPLDVLFPGPPHDTSQELSASPSVVSSV